MMPETMEGHPINGCLLVGKRPRKKMYAWMSRGREKGEAKQEQQPMRIWFDIMRIVRDSKENDEHEEPNRAEVIVGDRLVQEQVNMELETH